mmetsp:Transcript_62546/g.109330  ORF Transcript_62546/g.109330 Transcript_62546/m.109330 type:complete len:89 (+) Transcript_62546:309-575(+)
MTARGRNEGRDAATDNCRSAVTKQDPGASSTSRPGCIPQRRAPKLVGGIDISGMTQESLYDWHLSPLGTRSADDQMQCSTSRQAPKDR